MTPNGIRPNSSVSILYASEICNVPPPTIVKWFKSGWLPGYRSSTSRKRRIPKATLIRFLKEHGMPLGKLDEDGVTA